MQLDKGIQKLTVVLFIACLAFVSCTKTKGCTDCNALNYDSTAEIENGTCFYSEDNFQGVYSVHDSITGPPSLDWEHRSYDIEISQIQCEPTKLQIANFSNRFTVQISIDTLEFQVLESNSNGSTIRSSIGYFTNDSIYGSFEYENEFGEVFYGNFSGIKTN